MSFLVSVSELIVELAASDAPIVLDASVLRVREPKAHYTNGRELFEQAHLPSARHADLMAAFSDPSSGLPFTAPDAVGFAKAAASVGVSRHDNVVVYDVYDGTWAARLWWLFRAYGYRVRVLDGGLRAWQAAGLPTVSGKDAAAAIAVEDAVPPHADGAPAFVDATVVERAIATGDALIVCGLRPAVYSGKERTATRAGHIPTSINIPYATLIDPTTKTHLDPTELLNRIGGADTPVITYCGGGVNAAGVAFALLRAGARSVSVYDGSLSEWASDPERPLTLGTEPGDAPICSEPEPENNLPRAARN